MKSRVKSHPQLWLILVAAFAIVPIGVKADAPAPSPAQARYEVKFMTDMIDHHQMAVMMAELCLDRAVHGELQMLCEEMKTAQMEEIELMQGWLLDWYGIAYEPHMPRGHHQTMEHMAELAGEEFEIEFMERMIRHHAGAVREGMRCMDRAYHEELLTLCHHMVEMQLQEIDLMQTWLCEWFKICRE